MKNKISFITGVTGHYMLKVLPREMKKKIMKFINTNKLERINYLEKVYI